jgi:hypothetical protein
VPTPEDLSSTLRDYPIIELPDERQRVAERSQEVAGLRAALGLRIEEPENDPCQVSAMVVNLERGEPDPNSPGPTIGTKAGPRDGMSQDGTPQVRRLSRPVEERQYVPRLSVPTRRPHKPSSEAPNLARAPSRFGRVAGVVIAALMLLGAAAAVYLLTR